MANLELGTLIYTLARVESVGEVQQVAARGALGKPPVPVRHLQLVGPEASLTLSLWASLATSPSSEALQGKVISLRGARVREYQGQRNLSLSPPYFYVVDPEEPGVTALVTWMKGQDSARELREQEELHKSVGELDQDPGSTTPASAPEGQSQSQSQSQGQSQGQGQGQGQSQGQGKGEDQDQGSIMTQVSLTLSFSICTDLSLQPDVQSSLTTQPSIPIKTVKLSREQATEIKNVLFKANKASIAEKNLIIAFIGGSR